VWKEEEKQQAKKKAEKLAVRVGSQANSANTQDFRFWALDISRTFQLSTSRNQDDGR